MQIRLVELRLLGHTELRGVEESSAGANLLPAKRLALLAYLALETADGFRRRDQIVGLLWPDLSQEAARAQLRKACRWRECQAERRRNRDQAIEIRF